MKQLIMLATLFLSATVLQAQKIDYNSYPVYTGNDLGLTYTIKQSSFRIWSPPASKAELLLYKKGMGDSAYQAIAMRKSEEGTWVASISGDQKGKFYAFRVFINDAWSDAVPDPYAKAVGINGKRAMIVDLKQTNPPGWDKDKS